MDDCLMTRSKLLWYPCVVWIVPKMPQGKMDGLDGD
jgi:hypothetical protein